PLLECPKPIRLMARHEKTSRRGWQGRCSTCPPEVENMARRTVVPGRKKGGLTVAEAGRKGGKTVRDRYGREFYEEIGRKGGRRVRDLIAAGRRAARKRP